MNSGRNLGLVLLACLVLTAVSSQAQTNFYWTNNAGGAWSTSASWTNGLPIAGGSSDYSLIFQNTSAVITTNDIGTPGYILNKLQFSGANTLTIFGGAGTNLIFTNNTGGVLPQIVQNTASNITLNIGLNLATNTIFAGTGVGSVTVNSNIAGLGALIMSAPNYTLTLSASNTYSGGTIISNGIIRIASTVTNNSANTVLGSGNTTIVSGGALDLTGVTTTNSLYFSGKTFTIAGSGVTNSGAIFNNSAVTQINAFQKIILAGDASVGGSQRYDIRGGVATLDLANNTLTKTGTGYIGVVGGLITAGNIVISNGTFSIQTSTVCTGTVGTITVQTGGALDFYQTTAGKITRPIRLNGGSITIGSTATVDSPITLATNATINTSSGSLTLNGTIVESGGSFALTKLGANTLTLTNNTAYTGGTVVNAGNIQFNTLASVPISGLITINAGGTLNASGAYTPDGWLTSGRIATNSAGTLALTAYNNAPLDFSSSNFANLYLGAVGTITNDGAITPANNTYRLGGGGGTLVITNNLALTSANSLIFNTNGANNVSLTGSNTYSGGTTIGGATIGWLYASNNSALGTGPVTLTTSVNGGLWVYGGTTLSNNLVIGDSTGNGTFQVSGGNVNMAGNVTLTNLSGINIRIGVATGSTLTFNGVISGTIGGALMFNRTTFGAIVFNTNMTYTASSTLIYGNNSGSGNSLLQIGVNNALPTNLALLIASHTGGGPCTFDLNGHSQTIAGLGMGDSSSVANNIVTNSVPATLATFTIKGARAVNTFGGIIAGNIALVVDSSTQALTNNSTFTGGTTVTNGAMLLLGSTNALGIGPLTVTSDAGIGTTYAVDQTFVNWVTNTAGTAPGVILLGANSASNLTFGGSLSNTFLGAAGGAYSYSGNATWPDTTVRLGGGSSNLIYATVIGSGTNLLVGPIGGNAASIVSVTNAAHNPDTTTIQSGTLQVGNNSAGTLGTGTVSITSGATLTFYNNATMTNTSGVISGPGAVAARGSVVYMPSSNAYTGGTFLNGGNVRLALGDDNALGTGPITFSSAGNNPALSSIGSTMRTLTNSIVIGTNVTFGTGTDNGLLVFTSDVNLTGGTRTLTVTAPVTFNSVITNGGLTKAGTAQLTLTGTNTYALGTILTAGTLSIGDYANLPTTGPVTFNGGTLQITGTTVTDLNPYTINWTNFNGGLDIASSANTLTINTNITSSAAFYKYGDGTLIMGGTNSLTGGINVKGGTLEIGSIASLTNSGMTVGGTTTATLRLDNGGQIFATGDSVIGNTNALNGAVIQDGGIFTSSAALRLATYSNATVAAYQMNGGAINLTSTANSYLLVGRDGVGTFMQSGGTVTVARTTTGWGNGALTLGSSAGATGIYTLAGGTLNVTNSNANSTTVIGYGGTGFLTISNVGTVANLAGPIVLGGNGGTGTVNLVAGELRFTSMFVGTTNGLGTFNWSGGTLRPFSTDAVISNNLPLMLTGAGATFNTLDAFSNTRNITVLSTINENGGSYGLTKLGTGALILAGTNTYSGGTEVRAGGLSFANTSAKPVSGTVNVFSNAALGLGVGGTGYFSSADVDALWGNSLSGVTMDPDALVGIDTSAGNFTYTTIQSTRGLAKFGANTLTISNANTYPGPTVIYGGTLQINDGGTLGNGNGEVINNARLAFNRSDTYTINNSITGTGSILISANGSLTPASVFAITGSLTLGETNGNVGNFNLANNSASIGGLTVSNHNITTPSTLTIGNGQTLVVNGPFQVGAGVAVANNTFTTKLTVSGAGSLIVTNLGGTILFGNSNGNIKDVHNLTTVDMLGLGTFIANLGTNGTFRLGSATTETGVASNLTTFATNTIITAGTVRIDHQGASAGADIVRLGVGSNTINANTINVGVGDIRAHNTYLQFATNTGTVSIHAADGVGAANLTIGVRRGTGNITNVVDFTGHLVDLNLNLLDVGGNGFNVSGGSQILGSFAVDAGTTRVTTVRAGSMQNLTTNGQAVGIITFGGGEVQVGSGGITLATNFTALTSTRLNGTLNVSGGTVTVGTNSAGNSLTLTAGNGINNALVNLTGGQLTLGGHAVMGAAGGANTATVTLAGATLDLTGHNIGSGTQPINLSLQSGTLVNLGEINGGAPLVKTTGGTLTVLGNNSYSGGTLISGGTLQLGDGTANNGSVIGNITNNAALVFANPNAQTFDGVISGSGTVTKNAAGTLTFTGTNTYTGTTTITAGSLLINGTQTSGGLINVLSGGTLGGTGTLGNVTVYAGGVFAPGNGGAGTQMTGMLSMTGGLYRATLVNSNSFSQVVVANTLNVSSTPTNYLELALSSFTPESNASYLIIKNDSLVPWTSSGNGLFTLSDPSGPNNGLVLTNGIEFKAVGPLSTTNTFRIIYDFAAQGGVANDVLLTVIPEPTTASLLLMLLLAGGTRRLVRHLRPHGSD